MSAASQDPLGPQARALFDDLVYAGELSGADVLRGEAGSTAAGTRVRFCLQLSGDQVRQARYRAYGCPFTLATCEWLARQLTSRALVGGSAAQALRAAVGTPADWAATLGIPASRLGRLLVIEDALRICCSAAYSGFNTGESADESVTDSG